MHKKAATQPITREHFGSNKNHNIRSTTSIATWARMYSCTVITVFAQKAQNHESSKELEIGIKLCLIIW